ncbi:MAG: hypothetical protein ABW109_16115 [Candidatus Thiodiazotropha sp. 6PLUC4]
MQNLIDEIQWRLTAQLAGDGIDFSNASEAVQAMSSLPVETEEDRHTHLKGFLHLADFLIEHGGEEISVAMIPQRDTIKQKLEAMYTPGAVYTTSIEIVTHLADGLRNGGSVDDLAEMAMTEIGNLDLKPTQEDAHFAAAASIRVISLLTAFHWLSSEITEDALEHPREKAIWCFWQSVENKGVMLDEAITYADTILQLGDFIETESRVNGVMIIFGLSLLMRPDYGPGLESIQQSIMELLPQLSGEQSETVENTNTEEDTQGKTEDPLTPDQILSEFSSVLASEGFSEYHLNIAMNRVQQLSSDTLEESEIAISTLNRVIDTALPYAPEDYKPSMLTLKEWMTKLITGEDMDEIESLDELNMECNAIRKDMKDELEEGIDVGAAFTKASLRLNFLIIRAADNFEEEMLAPVMKVMMEDLPALMSPFVPEDKKQTWRQARGLMGTINQGVTELTSDDELSGALMTKLVAEQIKRMTSSLDLPAKDLPAHITQFTQLFLAFSNRLTESGLRDNLGESDSQELERLSEAIKADLRMIASATTVEQILRHQKGGLRLSALEFRKFERRRLLMIADPDFPTASLAVDPNSIFFSGAKSTQQTVNEACVTLAMKQPTRSGLADYMHSRWQQLRSSAIAILDYSEYDASVADLQSVPEPGEEEQIVLSVAAKNAQVAYETGWALTLGVPIIITTRRGQPVPFDVDISPIFIEGNDKDVDRIVSAVQIALYGSHRRIANSTLKQSVQYARHWFKSTTDSTTENLLDKVVESNDATKVRLVLESVFDRLERKRPLIIVPAFEGSYPQQQLQLFHVTAFRTWSKVAEEEIRAACERYQIKYMIGYNRIDPDIMRAVWKDICHSSLIVVDITNLNPNALLELGIANALGRPTLVICQNQAPHLHLPAIQRIRIHYYNPQKRSALSTLLDQFFLEHIDL